MQYSNLEENKLFLPQDFKVPDSIENEHFRIRMATINDAVKDYDAVMSSFNHLNKEFPHWRWPKKSLTIEQNLIDLGWHQKEFQMRSSFLYTIVRLDESQILGSLYIDPSTKNNFDSEIHMWVRQSELQNELDSILFTKVKEWIDKEWPYKKVAYPGRDYSFEDWNLMT